MKNRFFVQQSKKDQSASIYKPTCTVRDRASLVPNPESPFYRMYAIVESGLTYLQAWDKAFKLNNEEELKNKLTIERASRRMLHK